MIKLNEYRPQTPRTIAAWAVLTGYRHCIRDFDCAVNFLTEAGISQPEAHVRYLERMCAIQFVPKEQS